MRIFNLTNFLNLTMLQFLKAFLHIIFKNSQLYIFTNCRSMLKFVVDSVSCEFDSVIVRIFPSLTAEKPRSQPVPHSALSAVYPTTRDDRRS